MRIKESYCFFFILIILSITVNLFRLLWRAEATAIFSRVDKIEDHLPDLLCPVSRLRQIAQVVIKAGRVCISS